MKRGSFPEGGGQRQSAPSMEEVLAKIQQKMSGWGGKSVRWIVVAVVVGLWLVSGVYVVGPGELGVIRQFGKEVTQTAPGLRYRFPWPIQSHDVVDIATVRRAEIGFRTDPATGRARPMYAESLMLTGDENIVDNLTAQGRFDEAKELYDSLCARANPLGLLPEQIDPETGAFLGNFPQAFSHVGVIASGAKLAHRRKEQE